MSVYETSEGSVPAIRDSLLETAWEDCREKCSVARAVAYETAVFIVKDGVTVEMVKPKFGEVIRDCDGPAALTACGRRESDSDDATPADEDCASEASKKTFKCVHNIHKAGESILAAVKLSL